ncbi:hypothetical protein [Paenibacillus sp. L3-i20]|uniref:hypothetical protein n=1 Tax=Paenibacillus sp. L3-i20 TaxID=2905833 RepID=UPI001EDDF328|nr:hypothetical protein [Paenibacillus sp. L3-i20]GKU79694.1 hypothetical protein L3i20_v240910 [Paenibacillus sp. L3-i20]
MKQIDDHNDEHVSSAHKSEYEKSFRPTNSGLPSQLPNVNEEMGAEFAHGLPVTLTNRDVNRTEAITEEVEADTSGGALGFVSLLFAIASMFIWPVLMGATAAVLGYVAYRQGSRALGGWAMTIGIIAVTFNIILVPLYYALT